MNKEKPFSKPPGFPASSADAAPSPDRPAGPVHNPALGEIYQKLYPEMRRPRPSQEAIAAALQAMQNLAAEAGSEEDAEQEASPPGTASSGAACTVCGYHNRGDNKFCGMCGLAINPEQGQMGRALGNESSLAVPEPMEEGPQFSRAPGIHHYHHHYHHHYFPGGNDVPASRSSPESARETDRIRVAAAAKGEPMSRSEASVRRLTQEWVLACNTRQLEELLDLYAPDGLVLRSNHPPVRGAAALREFYFALLDSGLGEVEVEPLRVEVVGDVAHEVGRYSALVPGTVGKRREERGKYLWVFAKQSSGDWKLVSDCWSSDLTLPGAESDFPKVAAVPAGKTPVPRKGV